MDEAWRLEEAFWEASIAGEVPDYYARVLASDGIVVVPGQVLDRNELLGQWVQRTSWDDWAISERRTVLVNGETLVLCYRVLAHSTDEPYYAALVSSVYIWGVEGWVLALRQHTPDPDARYTPI